MTPAGMESATFRFVAQHLNHCATAVPNRKEYQKYFLGGKGGRCVKSGSLNLVEPSGPVQVSKGIALPFTV